MTNINIEDFECMIDPLAMTFAFEYHDKNWKITEEDKLAGRLAAALQFFDLLTENCTSRGCYDLSEKSYQYLDDLSLDTCVRLKAYHEWRAKGEHYPTSERERLDDYFKNLNSVIAWCESGCRGKQKAAFNVIQERLKKDRYKMIQKKAYWCFLADDNRSFDDNYAVAVNYINDLENAFNKEVVSPDIINFLLQRYKHVISAYEFIALACKTKI